LVLISMTRVPENLELPFGVSVRRSYPPHLLPDT